MSASPQDLLHADQAARRLAQTEFRSPLVLEAGAGTGKTWTLVARILAWYLGPGWERALRQEKERGLCLLYTSDAADEYQRG
mgnify:CR=1 FL=1